MFTAPYNKFLNLRLNKSCSFLCRLFVVWSQTCQREKGKRTNQRHQGENQRRPIHLLSHLAQDEPANNVMQVAQCVCEIPSFVKHAKAIKNESEGCHFPLGLMSRFVTFLSAILTQDNGDFPLTDRFDHWNYMLLQTAWIYFLFWVKLWLPTRPLALIQNAVWYIVPLSPQSKLVGGLVFVCAKPHFIWGAHSPTFSGEAAILFLVVVQSCFPITERLQGYTTDCTICYRTEDKNKRHLKGLGALHNRSIKSTVQSLILTCLACFTW